MDRFPAGAVFAASLLFVGLLGTGQPAAAASVRASDSLWISVDATIGEPKLTSLVVEEGETMILRVWLRVDAGPGYDVGAFYLPLFLDQPGEAHVRVGAAGGSSSPATSAVVPGTALDGSLVLFAPFSSWPVRALYEKSYPAVADTADLLLACAQSVAPGTGWNGRIQAAEFSVTGVAAGTTTIDLASHPLSGGGWAPPEITNTLGSGSWLPVMTPLQVTVTAPTGVTPGPAPAHFALRALLPAPSGGPASVQFDLPRAALVSIAAFDSRGRRVLEIGSNTAYPAGRHTRSVDFSRLGKGVYYYQLVAQDPDTGRELYRGSESYAHVR